MSRSLGEPYHPLKDFRRGRVAVQKLSHPRTDVVFWRRVALNPVDLVVVGKLRIQPCQTRRVAIVGLVQHIRVLVPIGRARRCALGNPDPPNRLCSPVLIRWSCLVEQQLDPIAIVGVDRIERRWSSGQDRVGVDIGRSRSIELQEQRALRESVLVKTVVSLSYILPRSVIHVGVPEPLVMECQRFGQKQLRLFHPKNYADVLTHVRIDGVVAVVAGIDQSIRCPIRWPIESSTANTKRIDVVFEAGHRRIGIPEIHHIDGPLRQGSGSKLVLDELIRDLFHAREEMISGNDQLSQAIQIASQELPRTQVGTGRGVPFIDPATVIPGISRSLHAIAVLLPLSLLHIIQLERLIDLSVGSLVSNRIIHPVAKRTIEIQAQVHAELGREQLVQTLDRKRVLVGARSIRYGPFSIALLMEHPNQTEHVARILLKIIPIARIGHHRSGGQLGITQLGTQGREQTMNDRSVAIIGCHQSISQLARQGLDVLVIASQDRFQIAERKGSIAKVSQPRSCFISISDGLRRIALRPCLWRRIGHLGIQIDNVAVLVQRGSHARSASHRPARHCRVPINTIGWHLSLHQRTLRIVPRSPWGTVDLQTERAVGIRPGAITQVKERVSIVGSQQRLVVREKRIERNIRRTEPEPLR